MPEKCPSPARSNPRRGSGSSGRAGRRLRPLRRQAHRRATPSRSSADIFRDGHEILRAVVRYRGPGGRRWRSRPDGAASTPRPAATAGRARSRSTRSAAGSSPSRRGSTRFASWRDELRRKVDAGQEDLAGELSEGVVLLEAAAERAKGADARALQAAPPTSSTGDADWRAQGRRRARPRARRRRRAQPRPQPTTAIAGPFALDVDRERARFGAWYELFPRSWGGLQGVAEAIPRHRRARLRRPLPAADPPDRRHEPQGPQQRARRRPGRPRLARGRSAAAEGGHDAIHPELGTIEDFDHLVATAREHGMDVALDFAIQCSADHPWLTEHPEWFHRRPDGTLKYAENPPKKYQDIYNVNWDCEDWQGLWEALRDVVLHWVDRGVKVFRVDNPHTKPFAVLGVADRGGPRGRPRRRLPRRGVHPARGDARAGQARLHPVLHVLHLEELAPGARSSTSTSSRRAAAGVLPAELLRQHAGHPPRVPAARRAARVPRAARARRHAVARPTASTPATSTSRTCRSAGLRGVPGLREVRDQASARSTARCCRSSGALNEIRRDEPRAAAPRQRPLPRRRQRRAPRLRQAARATTRASSSSTSTRTGRRRASVHRARRRSACRRSSRSGPAHRRAASTGGSAATTSASSPAAPTCCTSPHDRPRRRTAADHAQPAPLVRGRPAVVQERGLLRDPHPRVLRRQRRRLRRLPRADREARLPAVARRRLHLAAAVLPVAAARRRLRHRRLLPRSTPTTGRSRTSATSSRPPTSAASA